jgi:cytochrome P450
MTTTRTLIDFDHHSPEFAADPEHYYRLLHESGPAWSEHYGGFWVLGRRDDVAVVARDPITFSTRHDVDQETSFGGIQVPATPFHLTPLETDPPKYVEYRRVMSPFFTPVAVKRYSGRMVEIADWCLDQVIDSGKIDFVRELANPMPAIDALELVGLPVDDWERFAHPAHEMLATPPGTPERDHWDQEAGWIYTVVAEAIADRMASPRDDLISKLITATVDGQPIPMDELVEMISLVLFGGVETTTGLLGFAVDYLDRVPEDRQRLLDSRELVPMALEEMLRYFCPNQTEGRTATVDVEVGGQFIRKGERVLVCWAAANRDPAVFDRPDEVVIDRAVNGHVAFGVGPHRCIGSHFARMQSAVMLNRVLDRIPDYTLDRAGVEPYACIGTNRGYRSMPGTFTPGAKVAASLTVTATGDA